MSETHAQYRARIKLWTQIKMDCAIQSTRKRPQPPIDIRTDPTHLQMAWCRKNCQSNWNIACHRKEPDKMIFFFEDPAEAMLFKLTW